MAPFSRLLRKTSFSEHGLQIFLGKAYFLHFLNIDEDSMDPVHRIILENSHSIRADYLGISLIRF